jgi:hypothetical protein
MMGSISANRLSLKLESTVNPTAKLRIASPRFLHKFANTKRNIQLPVLTSPTKLPHSKHKTRCCTLEKYGNESGALKCDDGTHTNMNMQTLKSAGESFPSRTSIFRSRQFFVLPVCSGMFMEKSLFENRRGQRGVLEDSSINRCAIEREALIAR